MLRGTLEDFTLPDVLRLLALGSKTGVLSVRGKSGRGRVFFRAGEVHYAESSADAPSVAERLVQAGIVTDQEVDDALMASESSGMPVGEILTGSGRVSAEALHDVVVRQIHDASFDLMRMGEGEFSWQSARTPTPEVPVSVSVDELILEAARRLDEIAATQSEVLHEGSVFALSAAFASIAAPITIAPEEWRILALLDGRRTVTEVASLAGIDASEARRSLFHLLGTGVIEAAPTLPVAPPLPAPRVAAPIEGAKMPPPAPPSRGRPAAVDDAGDGAERARPPAPPAEEPAEDFALFQQAAIASAREVPASAPPGTQRVSDFDAPGPEDMTTRVPDPPAEKAAVGPPPPPPGPPRRARKSKEKSAAGTPLRADDDVDPALIARLIQGVKEL